MQINQIPLILSNEKKTNDIHTIKLSFGYYIVKLIECMIEFYFIYFNEVIVFSIIIKVKLLMKIYVGHSSYLHLNTQLMNLMRL